MAERPPTLGVGGRDVGGRAGTLGAAPVRRPDRPAFGSPAVHVLDDAAVSVRPRVNSVSSDRLQRVFPSGKSAAQLPCDTCS